MHRVLHDASRFRHVETYGTIPCARRTFLAVVQHNQRMKEVRQGYSRARPRRGAAEDRLLRVARSLAAAPSAAEPLPSTHIIAVATKLTRKLSRDSQSPPTSSP